MKPDTIPAYEDLNIGDGGLDFNEVTDRDLTEFEKEVGVDLLEAATELAAMGEGDDAGPVKFTRQMRLIIRGVFWVVNRKRNPGMTFDATADYPLMAMASFMGGDDDDEDGADPLP